MMKNKMPLTLDAIRMVADICGAKITDYKAPLIGDYIVIHRPDGTVRRIGEEPEIPAPLDVAYESINDSGEIIRVYIGSRYHGPMLMWSRGMWHNCYSRANYGKNAACGGNWCGDGNAHPGYATVREAISARRERIASRDMMIPERCKFCEGEAIYSSILALCEEDAQ